MDAERRERMQTATRSGHAGRHRSDPSQPRRARFRPKTLLLFADALAVLVATLVCTIAFPATGTGSAFINVASVALVPLLWIVLLGGQQLYAARRVVTRTEEIRRIGQASGGATAALALLAYVTSDDRGRAWIVVLPALAVALLVSEREIARRMFHRMRRNGRMARNVLIIGTNHEALELCEELDANPAIGYRVLGFVSDDSLERLDVSMRPRVLGGISEVPALVEATGAVGVIIASTAVTTPVSNRLARVLTDTGVHVELTSTLRDIVVQRLTVAGIGQYPTIYVEAVQRGGWRARAKRCFDFTLASLGLIALAPALLVVAVVVRTTSAGPVFFRQVRVGKDGATFELVKFRTMVSGAEGQLDRLMEQNEASGPLFKMTDDPRVTRVGKWLRTTSIDELPQLWNVVRGEMSLVGPRPALPRETAAWAPELHERLLVTPGITGMWQVNGRSNASFDEYVRLDLFYVHNWSLLRDLAIILRTIPAVVTRRGAS
jgi:exopolysaccharide biosynthesis polyprenyl glycosylphosphotransferase